MNRFTLLTLGIALLAAPAFAQDGSAKASARAELASRIEERALEAPAKATAAAQSKLSKLADKVDRASQARGDAQVAARLAGPLGTTATVLLEEKSALNASWGELAVAHTLAAEASGVSVENLVRMNEDGMSWGTLAAGLGIGSGALSMNGMLGAAVQGATGAAANASVQAATSAAGASVTAGLGIGLGR